MRQKRLKRGKNKKNLKSKRDLELRKNKKPSNWRNLMKNKRQNLKMIQTKRQN